jgi:4-hydroxybenzoate polyprenyltransferase
MEPQSKSLVPLYVDLDGTVLNTDMLLEAILLLVKQAPRKAMLCLIWVFFGRAYLKTRISENIVFDPTVLPYNEKFCEFLRSEKARGRPLYLITGSPIKIAQKIATHLGFFSDVFATEKVNLVSEEKLRFIIAHNNRQPFAYAGNSRQDLKIWRGAKESILVNTSKLVQNAAKKFSNVTHVFDRDSVTLPVFLKALRGHQWVKNILIFIPLVAAHKMLELNSFQNTLIGFVSFSLCASSVYVLNDMFDVNEDRKHRTKKFRPFASGKLPLWVGFFLNPALLLIGFALAIYLNSDFTYLLALYIVLTSLYTFVVKSLVLWDIILLASLYTLRIFVGGVLAAPVSPWLLAFSAFFFLSLALTKRYTELLQMKKTEHRRAHGRGYQIDDLEFISSLGVAASYMALLIFVFYINSADVTKLYFHPLRLWGLVPLLFYWTSRIWLFTHRGLVTDDPVIYALKDKTSYCIFGLGAIVMWYAL